MENEENKNINKYQLIEIIIGFFLFLIIDVIAIILDILGIGIIGPFVQFMGLIGMNIWAISKGDKESLKLTRQIIKYFAQIIPIAPTLTLIFLIETFLHNNKDKIEKIEKIDKRIQTIEKIFQKLKK